MTNCPVCDTLNAEVLGAGATKQKYTCPRCGIFILDLEYCDFLGRLELYKRAVLSHYIRRQQNQDTPKFFTSDKLTEVIDTQKLPDVAEQINLVIDYVGQESEYLGQQHQFDQNKMLAFEAYVGCQNNSVLNTLLSELNTTEFIKGSYSSILSVYFCELTLTGWQKYEEIKKGKTANNKAFMAMQFGDSALDKIIEDHFKHAVKQTGFELLRLNDRQQAGLIDIRMRQEIKNCKFVIADLSHGNKGAYWEAGFAEGVGKPVIYTCEKSIFEDNDKKPHFDVNHHLTIMWDAENPTKAVQDLKSAIRYTFSDAIQEDKNDQAA